MLRAYVSENQPKPFDRPSLYNHNLLYLTEADAVVGVKALYPCATIEQLHELIERHNIAGIKFQRVGYPVGPVEVGARADKLFRKLLNRIAAVEIERQQIAAGQFKRQPPVNPSWALEVEV